MARVHRLSTSNVEHTCRRGHVIPKGQPYSWAAPGFRARKRFACADHPFRPSELTTSLVSEALSAAENFEDAIDQIDANSPDALDELTSALEDFKGEIESYVSQREEAFDAWENGNSQLEELLETARAAYDEIESWEPEEWSGDEEARDDEDHEDHDDAVSDWAAHVEDQLSAARDLTGLDF